ncbi:DoxX family protein [Flavobacterium sp. SUN046]|uniref:DoxX family protein n=1 Tax=Flavobacterium sp. SUN046 TaxID=3002440 RepID=UPI002DBD70D2|nr:DoxX family protein [Flavobacterium sp. SUN046]MEC4047986.1 DoxX family protein [Flavobacterium sp. SUN046]
MKKIKKLTKPMLLPFWWQDVMISIPRIVCGYLLTANFGAAKFGMPWSPVDNNLGLFEVAFWFPKDVAAYGGIFAIAPAFFAWIGAFSEAVGGLFLLLGFQTRIASFLLLMTMLVAVFMQQINNGLWNCLPAMGFLWVSLYTLIMGSGRIGIDYLISKKHIK